MNRSAITNALGALCLVTAAAAQSPVVHIGVAMDGPRDMRDRVRQLLVPEVMALIRDEYDVRFRDEHMLLGDGTLQVARETVGKLLRDPEVSIVVTVGAIVSHVGAAELGPRRSLSKPLIAPFVIDATLQQIPHEGRASGLPNLSYIAFPSDVRSDLRIFRQAVEFDTVAMVVNRFMSEAIPGLASHYAEAAAEVGVESVVLPVAGGAELLSALPAEVDAVFLALPLFMEPAELKSLTEGLIERGLPSFSAPGTSQVQAGMLVGLHADADISRLARRIALNIQQILEGKDAGSLDVLFSRSERLTVNMATARALGVYPPWSVLTEAELLNDVQERGRQLTLVSTVSESIAANLELVASDRGIAAGKQEVQQARASLLPKVDLGVTGVVVDEDLGGPFQAQRSATGSGGLTQLVYSEPALANLRIQRELQKSREQMREQLRLDIAGAAATAYFNVLRAKTLERVQKHNLALTRSNLELARVRQQIGISAPAEVYRWESQMATARSNGIRANAQRNVAQIALNQLLHRPLEEPFVLAETGLFDERLVAHDERFINFIDNKSHFAVFRAFMVEDGLANSPEIRALDAAIAAQERALTSARRAFYLPTVALRGDVTGNLARGGAGSEFDALGGDATWTLGVNASFPLLTGGDKRATQRRADEQLEQLKARREAVAERLEQRIRSALHISGASYAGISLSHEAAVAAARNLELVKDAYGRDVVSILDLLDAQNAAIVAEEGAANGVYNFLIDLMEVERAIGQFYFLATDEQREAWFTRALAYLEKAR